VVNIELMRIEPGTKLGAYEIVSPIGAGGMGEVYRAKDLRLGRDVAIKVLPEKFAQDANALSRFEKETRALAALSHPNILRIYDIGSDKGISYAVMELLEGVTLRERLNHVRLQWREALEYAIGISDGLSTAHTKGIIHRDLKPENIFLTSDAHIKILDFGLVRIDNPSSSQDMSSVPTDLPTETGIVLGTVPYMSPEQTRGEKVDARSDIFSFGCILYEMLSGKRAFAKNTSAETVAAILKDAPHPMELPADAPKELQNIVSHCIEKNADDRFQSARDLAFQLRQLLSGIRSTQFVTTETAKPSSKAMWFVLSGILIAGLAFFGWSKIGKNSTPKPVSSIHSLAVMPLTNFSGDSNQDYFADGMTEALITDLAQIKSIKVISRTSVMQYKGTKKSLKEIADELKVDGVVEGSIIRAGDRVRINAQLIQAANDQHLWAQSYDKDAHDILALQSEVAEAVAHQIQAAITPEEEKHLSKTKKVDPEVHELYLKARYLTAKGGESDLKAALELLRKAIDKDPGNAQLYVGLSAAYAGFADFFLAPAEVMPQAKAAALKAVEFDGNSPEAHTVLGNVQLLFDYDWPAAERSYKRAIQLNSNNAEAYQWYSVLCAVLGRRNEALSLLKKAYELDPLSPQVNTYAIWITVLTRDYDLSMEYGRKALEFDPKFPMYHFQLSYTYAEKGDFKKAITLAEKAEELYETPMFEIGVAQQYAIGGKKKEAEELLHKLLKISQEHYVCPYEMAVIYVNLNQTDTAFEWLERSYNERSMCIIYLKADPRLDPIRSDPRYKRLLEKMHFSNR